MPQPTIPATPAPGTGVSDEELDRAIRELEDPRRFRQAERLAARAAPGLQRILTSALEEGGWFGSSHREQVEAVLAIEDPGERVRMLRTLLAEETRIGMLVGVAVGWELGRRLDRTDDDKEE